MNRSSDLPEFMRKVSYSVEKRTDRAFAVIRNGTRGGKRMIDVYDNPTTAQFVCNALNGAALHVR